MNSSFSLQIVLFFCLASGSVFSGCSSFSGPGRFKSPDGTFRSAGESDDDRGDKTVDTPQEEEGSPVAAPVGPTLSWSGERYSQSAPTTDMKFDWPVEDAKMSRGFLLGKRWHYGLDLAAKKGTPILASEAGVVIYAGRGFSGYGKLIVIEHNDTWATLYSHLDRFSVKEGQRVSRGQKIGEMGRTGRASGVHLHFEIRYNRQPVNPLMYLPQGY